MDEKNLESWACRLNQQDMPLFTRTVHSVCRVAGEENASVSELTWNVLQDPSLTAQVLKISNSMYYNPASFRINTVSRAIMRLGFDTVKSMCLSIALVETVLSSAHRERVALEIARAFHAAVQAKQLAIKQKLPVPEEVFIAALLSRIGHIAFWCFAGEVGDQLESAINAGVPESRAEMEVLGFRIEELTLNLCRKWQLSDILETMLERSQSTDPRVQSIDLGYCIARSSERGWDSPQTAGVIKKIGDFLKVSETEATKIAHENALNAAEITESYGAGKSSRLIPLPLQPVPEPKKKEKPPKVYPEPDQQVQMKALRELTMLLMDREPDVNRVLSIMMDGIYRGVGIDRVLFALLSKDRQFLKGKFGLGWDSEENVLGFRVAAIPPKPNIFSHMLRPNNPVWVKEDPHADVLSLITREVLEHTGGAPFFIMPVVVRGQAIGVLYADRGESGRELDKASFENFTFLGFQANMVLSYQQADPAQWTGLHKSLQVGG